MVTEHHNIASRILLKGVGGNKEHSAPATATPPTSKVHHPSQLLPEQRHVHLVVVKYCKDTRPRISWRPPSNSIATSAAISQGPQLKSPSIPSC
eukprot:1144396-Pelagomonas_calceolata.AAC.2